MTDYIHVEEGVWYEPARRKFREQCCDCGLVHVVDFRVRNGKIEFRSRRDDRATAAVRRSFKFERDE